MIVPARNPSNTLGLLLGQSTPPGHASHAPAERSNLTLSTPPGHTTDHEAILSNDE